MIRYLTLLSILLLSSQPCLAQEEVDPTPPEEVEVFDPEAVAATLARPPLPPLDEVLMLSPSAKFVRALPGGKVPDRGDFEDLPTEARQARWWEIVGACKALAEELHEGIETGRIVEQIEPF